jgi:hypothetical protein
VEAPSKISFGGDLRLREEYFDSIPIKADPPGVTRNGENNYFRVRTRLWMQVDPIENVSLRARAVNEFREWDKPDMGEAPDRSSYEFPDEIVFDNLYVEARDLLDKKLDLRVGRQDMIYGTGKLILEGTPKDGSRTIYFTGAKATWKGIQDTTIDLFGIYNESLDELAINDSGRDLTGVTSANNDITESGGGLYVKNSSNKEFPFEVYGIYKSESEWESGPATNIVKHDDLQLSTAGFRLMPSFSERLKGNFEFAYQLGDRGDQDVRAFGADAFLVYSLPVLEDAKPAVDFGLYYLSGDDPETDKDEGWNPLWARYPQYSELYVYAWDADAAGRWSNVSMPHVGLTLSPLAWLKTTAMVGYLMAPEENGPGGGSERGLLTVLKGEFTIKEKLLTRKDKLTGHLWLEMLEPGDYYKVDDTALFARWELAYAF